MRALSDSRLLRFFTFGALYFAQGVPWGFVSTGYVVFMADQGLSNEQVGEALSYAYLVFTLKVLAAPLLDALPIARLGLGRRRPYIVAAQLMMGATLFYLAGIGDLASQLPLVTAILIVHNACAALQDIAVDALAVDLLAAEERGRANSIMWASKVAGVAVGGGGGTYLAKLTSWPTVMMGMAVLIWVVMVVPLLVREENGRFEPRATSLFARKRDLVESFSFAPTWAGFLIAFLGPFGFALVPAFTTRALRADFHYSEEMFGLLNGVIEPVSGAVGAVLGGLVADRAGTKRAMAVGMVGAGVLLAVFGLNVAHWSSFSFVATWTVVYGLFVYTYQAACLGMLMTLSNPAIGATHFALYMATVNFCYMVTSRLGGQLADRLGYGNTYLVAAAVQLAAIALLPLCNLARAEARFHGNRAAPDMPSTLPSSLAS